MLIQKPMGRDLAEARTILALCRERELVAAINFQLRFAPNMLALRDALTRGLLGDITDVEVRINAAHAVGVLGVSQGRAAARSR